MAMKVNVKLEFETDDGSFFANVSGRVTKHFGFLHVSEFDSDVPLTMDERATAEDELIQSARSQAFIPETEPEAMRRY